MTGIKYQKGDIFESKAQVIVNTVNCQGVMGKGLALAFKQRYPAMFPVYQQECKAGRLRIGRPSLYKESAPWILNFPTKDTWKANSKIEYLEKGLEYFIANYKKAGITSVAFPKLGAQNGKLSWDDVGPLMAKYLSSLEIDVYIYIAEGDKEYQYDEAKERKLEAAILQYLNELALAPDRLKQEVKLSQKDAKKVFARRETSEFTAISDVYTIEGLSKAAIGKLKNHIAQQRHSPKELPGISDGQEPPKPRNRPNVRTPKRKRKSKPDNEEHPKASLLFALEEVMMS
jgi:O-acetyl-ADP-ribose deacetylase (regulator of RNase III)